MVLVNFMYFNFVLVNVQFMLLDKSFASFAQLLRYQGVTGKNCNWRICVYKKPCIEFTASAEMQKSPHN